MAVSCHLHFKDYRLPLGDRSSFLKIFQTLYEENRTSYSEIDNLDDALHFLYELGAIGNAWKSKKGKHRTCWYYKIDAIDEVDLSQNFTIHYGLRKKFSL